VSNILAYHPARELPIYREGVSAGVDVGTRQSLNVIVAELTRQEDAAVVAALNDPNGRSAALHEYTLSRLQAVARIVSAAFRARPG
jgi:hypothetical protein